MQPASAEALLRAFQVMDPDNKGYVTRELLSKNMLELGEPFTEEELEEMMTVAVDPETGNIPYEYYINQIMVGIGYKSKTRKHVNLFPYRRSKYTRIYTP